MPDLRQHHNQPIVNPFDEVKTHVSEYTAAEIGTLSRRLEKQLGPEYISARVGPGGGKVHYLSADKCIGLANEVFGFNGWSSSIQAIEIDFVDENEQGRVSIGLSVILRVTLRDGTHHEDIGYGHIENCKGKAAGFEKAKKEGTTDALKRALRNFGNVLGNCIYDKDYVSKVTRLKAGPTRWDPNKLHRHSDYAPIDKEPKGGPLGPSLDLPPHVRQEASEGVREREMGACGLAEDEFGSDDFDAVDFAVSAGDHPDETDANGARLSDGPIHETVLPDQIKSPSKTRSSNSSRKPRLPSPVKPMEPQTPNMRIHRPKPLPPTFQQSKNSMSTAAQPHGSSHSSFLQPASEPPFQDSLNTSKEEPPVGFFTARVAESVQAGATPAMTAPLFNPRLESPSIRKTVGVDHSKTKPINRDFSEAAPPPLPSVATEVMFRGNIINPQSDKARRVGMPGGTASPMQNRGSYRPPQMKRTGDTGALKDVTAASINSNDKTDVKRQKLTGGMGLEAENATLKI